MHMDVSGVAYIRHMHMEFGPRVQFLFRAEKVGRLTNCSITVESVIDIDKGLDNLGTLRKKKKKNGVGGTVLGVGPIVDASYKSRLRSPSLTDTT